MGLVLWLIRSVTLNLDVLRETVEVIQFKNYDIFKIFTKYIMYLAFENSEETSN